MAVMLEAQQLRAQGIDVIDLGPGQPDFPTPEPIKKAGIDAIIRNFTRYTASAGLDELREGIAESFNRRWDTHFGAENVVVTAGAKPAVFNVCMAAFQDGDEVVIPSPYWVTFPEVVKLTGASPVQVPTFEENGFVPEMDSLESVLTDRTRGLILNTPNNPTGAVIPESVLGQLIEWTRSRGLFLLSDETYGEFTYAGREHVSLAAYLGESAAAFAVVGSFSKVHSMTGWRIGYCLGPTDLMAKAIRAATPARSPKRPRSRHCIAARVNSKRCARNLHGDGVSFCTGWSRFPDSVVFHPKGPSTSFPMWRRP